jgi:hypothetical protein
MADKDKFNWEEKAKDLGGIVPFYPKTRYIEENLAPEKNLTVMQIEALAHANQDARKNKLMSSKMLDKMLPTLMVESASGTRGWGYPDQPKYRDILEKANLDSKDPNKTHNELVNEYGGEYGTELWKARMMHAMMAAKVANYGEDIATTRWNGEGRNRVGWGMADADNHARKVEEAQAMLAHPINKPIMDSFNHYSKLYKPGNHTTSITEAPMGSLEDEINNLPWEARLPSAIQEPISAVREAIPSMQDIRNKIRDFTAPTAAPLSTIVEDNKQVKKKIGGKVKLPDGYKNGGNSGLI